MKRSPLIAACAFLIHPIAHAHAGPAPIGLGSAASFAVLAGAAVTNTGSTVVNGNLGVWPGQSITGFPLGIIINGNSYAGDAVAMQAQQDANTAYIAAAGAGNAVSLTGQDLGGLDLMAGVYSFSSSAQLTGTLTLNANGAQNAWFIFQIASTLNTAQAAVVDLINANSTDHVIWQVGSSATLGAATSFSGDILALESISLDSSASISCGGAWALNGAVTMIDNSVSVGGAACGVMPVPEPATMPVLLAGLIGIAVSRLKKGFRHNRGAA